MKRSIKLVVLLAALILIIGIVVDGTVAWLIDSTDSVENKFTSSDITVTLSESKDLNLQMIPGHTIKKDPKVTVEKDSEKCYVFVKLDKSVNYDTFLAEYEIADEWTLLTDFEGVYYQIVGKSEKDQTFTVLKENQVKVKDTVTKANMETIKDDASQPTLTITAYACQYNKNNTDAFTPAEAWAQCNPTTSSN